MKDSQLNDRQSLLLANPVFISSLLLLLLNDFVFKPVYHNWLTGKLSDFCGLIAAAALSVPRQVSQLPIIHNWL